MLAVPQDITREAYNNGPAQAKERVLHGREFLGSQQRGSEGAFAFCKSRFITFSADELEEAALSAASFFSTFTFSLLAFSSDRGREPGQQPKHPSSFVLWFIMTRRKRSKTSALHAETALRRAEESDGGQKWGDKTPKLSGKAFCLLRFDVPFESFLTPLSEGATCLPCRQEMCPM